MISPKLAYIKQSPNPIIDIDLIYSQTFIIVHCKWQSRRILFKAEAVLRATSENSVAREERARESETRVNERLAPLLLPPVRERELLIYNGQ